MNPTVFVAIILLLSKPVVILAVCATIVILCFLTAQEGKDGHR